MRNFPFFFPFDKKGLNEGCLVQKTQASRGLVFAAGLALFACMPLAWHSEASNSVWP
jgi:hypothetical protein